MLLVPLVIYLAICQGLLVFFSSLSKDYSFRLRLIHLNWTQVFSHIFYFNIVLNIKSLIIICSILFFIYFIYSKKYFLSSLRLTGYHCIYSNTIIHSATLFIKTQYYSLTRPKFKPQ